MTVTCSGRIRRRFIVLVAVGGLLLAAGAGATGRAELAGVRALRAVADREAVSVDPRSGAVRSLRLRVGGAARSSSASGREQAAAEFLGRHRAAFGLADPARELSAPRRVTDAYGQHHLRYRQRHHGLPVFGGRLRAHFDAGGALRTVTASIVPAIDVDATPRRTDAEASRTALAIVAHERAGEGDPSGLEVRSAELMFFRAGWIKGVLGPDHLVWAIEVADREQRIRESVFIDAHSGKLVEHYTRIAHSLDRRVSESSLGNGVWSEGDPDPIPSGWAGGDSQQREDWQNEIDGAAEMYHLVANLSGGTWLSYDGADAPMRTVNNDPAIDCPNANWNGISTNYCSDVTGDDTVAHEWAHGYTEYSHDLVYAWQPGALNEAYSDIWGEVVDLLNGRGSDTPGGARSDGSCSTRGLGNPALDDSYRWLAGEDSPALGVSIRDLWHPTCFNDPGKVSDPQYHCAASDSGGVHSNSGVPNHAFALLVDGGGYNGRVVQGLGLTKATHLYWYAQMQFQTPTSGFAAHADALEAACSALVGVPLYALATASVNPVVSGELLTLSDCDELAAAIAAVELRQAPDQCGFESLLASPAPPRCEGLGEVEPIASNDWEGGLAGWTPGQRAVADPSDFAAVGDWRIVSELPEGRAGAAVFGPDPVVGDCAGDDVSGVSTLESPDIPIPEGAEVPRVAFDHRLATEAGWDGGNLKWSVNGGPFALVAPERLVFNPYNAVLQDAVSGNTNPLEGEPAFTGADGGSVSSAWGQTQVSLAGLVEPGDVLRLRFELGLDGCNGLDGWYVDDLAVYSCSDEVAPVCGDGIWEVGQACDDGNAENGDGCSSSCFIEPGHTCIPATSPSVCIPLAPGLDLQPGAVSVALEPGGTTQRSLSVANGGANPLHWHASEGAPAAAPVAVRAIAGDPDLLPLGPIALTHSFTNSLVGGTSVACLDGSNHLDNRYLRLFDLDDFGVGAPLEVTSVEIAIESAAAASGSQPVSVRIHRLDGAFELANLTLLGETSIAQANTNGGWVDIPVSAQLAAGDLLVAEIHTPSGVADDAHFFAGANSSGQTGPTYLVAPGCDIHEPTDLADIGFPNMHLVLEVRGILASACDSPAELPWLAATPTAGSLAIGENEIVDLSFDASGLADGVHAATLCFDSNDRAAPLVELPIELVVGDDPDQDGVSTTEENAAPGGGDGNRDGIPDALQDGVASVALAGGFVTLATELGCRLNVDLATAAVTPPDPGFVQPHGVIGFSLRACDRTPAQDIVTVRYHDWADPSESELAAAVYRSRVPENVAGWSESGWYGFPFASVFADDPTGAVPALPALAVRLPMIDGRHGDSLYGPEDGEIVHVGAVALPSAFVVNASPIPALSRTGRALLAMLLLFAARSRWRRRSGGEG